MSKNSLFEKLSALIPSVLDDQIVEDDHEDEEPKIKTRSSRFKMIKDKYEFGKNRVHSQDEHIKEKLAVHQTGDFGSLHEDDEEHKSDSSEGLMNQRKGKPSNKTYSIGYLTKQIWAKRIYSDDFDMSKENKLKGVAIGSIQEDNEAYENDKDLSDNSSSSALTNKLRRFSLDITKYFDKSDKES